ncbi:hypothetical protein FRUB_09142 [Fimbriiglobus ruber]|uniref:Uncharacterized protein n=1 Tax=Fimbriiglobus ruber TaxID=1908690 RepID=A0A225DH94_9BACT|nr:hypothetical protein FRUB_09142 [Fimbriiglobus ruber]
MDGDRTMHESEEGRHGKWLTEGTSLRLDREMSITQTL